MELQDHQAQIHGLGSFQLILMRHFSAQNSQFGIHDRDRALIADKSQEEFNSIKKKCAQDFQKISLVVCSNTKRTRQTLEQISSLLPSDVEILISDSLYHADMNEILDHIRSVDLDYKTVLVIGHNPGLGYFLQEVQKENFNSYYACSKSFPAGGVAIFERICESWIKTNYATLKLKEMIYIQKDQKCAYKGYSIEKNIF